MKAHRFSIKIIAGFFLTPAIFGVLLFLPAWTLNWPRAWAFLGVVLVSSIATMVTIFPARPDLLDERYKTPIQKGQPLADRFLVMAFVILYDGVIAFIPLDVFHFHLLGKPGAIISWIGLLLFVVGWTLITLSFKENAFAALVVKHQEERHQTVIATGVYGIVRHPMYSGGILALVGVAFWLESYVAAVAAAIPLVLIVMRILVEERFLKRELEGYEAYTKKVRDRLVPFIW